MSTSRAQTGMPRLFLALTLALVLGGCASKPVLDLSRPRELLLKGDKAEAFRQLLAAYEQLGADERADAKADQTRAEILLDFFHHGAASYYAAADELQRNTAYGLLPALKDESGAELLALSSEVLSRVLATSVDAEQHVACAGQLAAVLRLKIEYPRLRQLCRSSRGFEELLYRRLVRESIADFELFALVRMTNGRQRSGEKAAVALDALAGDYRALAELPTTHPEAAAFWLEAAAQAATLAAQVRLRPGEVKLHPELRDFVESTLERHLQLATAAHDVAVRRYTGREDASLVIEEFEDSLRHALFAREAIIHPTPRQRDVFVTWQLDLEQLARLSQKR